MTYLSVKAIILFPRLYRHGLLFAFRGISTASKFLLTLYAARYLGLADLGVYGLVAAAAAISPAVLGFGLTDWVVRHVVMAERAEALRKISARLIVSATAHVVFQPMIWTANFALGSPVPTAWLWFIAPIVLLEHLASDAHDLLIARGQIMLTSTLQFIRAALWPLAVVAIGLLYPETRSLNSVFAGWLLGLALMWSVLVGWFLLQRAPVTPSWKELSALFASARASFILYVRDIAGTISLFIDRYLISLTLGLELTGVYIFFWSAANVVHGMINSVILQPQAARLITAVGRADIVGFRVVQRKTLLEATACTAVMSLAAFAAMVVLLPLLQRPALATHLSIFGIVLAATWPRIWADEFGFGLLALHRDHAILLASVTGALPSALLNVLLIPLLGLMGAALAFMLTGLLLMVLRSRLSRQRAL